MRRLDFVLQAPSAVAQYLDQLSRGDPLAIGFTVFMGLLVFAGVAIWVVDRRSKGDPKSASRRRRP
jgi:hypothetical protein